MRKRSVWIALFGAAASIFLAACSLLGLSEGLEQSRCMDSSFCASLNDSFPTGDPCKLWQCIDGFCAIGGRDADGDGFAAAECDEPGGREADCDDTAPGISPGAQERCPAVDEDCDGSVNEGLYAFQDAILEDLVSPETHEDVSYAIRPGTLEVAATWTDRNLPRLATLQMPRVTRHVADVIPVAVRDDVPDDEAERGRLPSSRGSAVAALPNDEYAFAYIEASGGCQRPVLGLLRSMPGTVTMRGSAGEERTGFAAYMKAADFDRGLPDENGRGCLRNLCDPDVECHTGATPDLRIQCEGTSCIKQCLVATECDARPTVMCTEPDVGADCNADMVNDERCAVTTPVTTMCRSAAMTACEGDMRCDWLGGTNTCVAARVTDACSSRLSMMTCTSDPACTWRTTFCVLTSSVTACPMIAQTACDATSGCEWTGSPTPTCAGIGSCAERCICPGDAATCVDTTRRCFTPRSADPCNRNVQCNEALSETCAADQPTEIDTAYHCDRPCTTSADCETGEDCEIPMGMTSGRCDPPDALFARMLSVATVDRAVAVTYARDNATVPRETCGEMSSTVGLYANFAFRSSTMSVREMQIMPDPAVKIGDTKDTAPAAILGLPGYGFLIAFTDPMFDIVFKRVVVDGDGTAASPYAFTLQDEPVLTLETGFDAMGRFPRSEVRLALGPRDGDRQQIGVVWHEKCAINGDVRAQLIVLDTATGTLGPLTADPLTIPSATRDAEQLPSIAYSDGMDAWIVTYEIDNQEVRAIRLFLSEGGNALETIPEDPFRVISAPMGSTISEASFAYPIPGMASFGAVGHLFDTPDDMDRGFYGAEFNCVEPPAAMDAGMPAP